MRAKFVNEYQKGQDPKRGLRIGKYSPGTVKDFDDVEMGDIAKDYNYGRMDGIDSTWEVIDKVLMKIDYNCDPINEFFPHISDPKVVQFLEQYDESSAMMDFLQHGVTPDMDGEEYGLIACIGKDWGGSVVWLYDDSGALVYW
jgi:hypothetical protein